MSTISKENYLKTIFNNSIDSGSNATATKLANDLSVSTAAITDMAKRLCEDGLVTYEKYKGMELTSSGEKAALKIIRRHRLWELFLKEVLEMSWSEVHDEAEKLEHHTSEFLIDKIDKYLNYPDFDPHGHPIPRKNGTIPKTPNVIPLSKCEKGILCEFVRVNDRDNELIDYLAKVGLELNSKFEVVDKLAFDQSISIRFNNKILSMSKKITESIFIRSVKI
jgi:DtxR family Mn-dependent transcriptional regulator